MRGRYLCGDVRFEVRGELGRVNLCHCSRCGSSVYARNVDGPHSTRVRLGTLEGDPGVRPGSHVWVGSKAPWSHVGDALPRFDGARPPDAES